jgi:hypothetical protein
MGQPHETAPEPRGTHGADSLSADDAANFLDISTATLCAWEQRFGFPAAVMSEHPAPNYLVTDLLALQDALPEALSITSAIQTARRRAASP